MQQSWKWNSMNKNTDVTILFHEKHSFLRARNYSDPQKCIFNIYNNILCHYFFQGPPKLFSQLEPILFFVRSSDILTFAASDRIFYSFADGWILYILEMLIDGFWGSKLPNVRSDSELLALNCNWNSYGKLRKPFIYSVSPAGAYGHNKNAG